MARIVYYGSFGNVSAGSDGKSAAVSGSPLPLGATITGVSFTLDISAGGYSSSNDWFLYWFAIGSMGGSPYAFPQTVGMAGTKHTFEGRMHFTPADLSKFTGGNFTVYAKANTDHNSSSYMGAFTITVDYDQYSACTEPSGLALSATASTGQAVTLSWSAGAGGTDNPFSYYQVGRRFSPDGNGWDALETLGTTTELSMSVEPPAAFGGVYMYYVRTVGTAGIAYASPWAACGDTLQKVRPALTAYTDATIKAGETPVRAVHMAELQSNINALRQAQNLAAHTFETVRAGYTSLAGWNAHIMEMRAAVDEITTSHEEWLALGDNRPRADVLMQLRRVVASI